MVIWVIFSLMTFAAVIAVLWPLSRPEPVLQQADDADIAFYREQASEIERELARGLLTPEEAEAARAEAGRRLLRSARGEAGATAAAFGSRPALIRRRAVAVLALVLIPLLGLVLYQVHGFPDYRFRSEERAMQQMQREQAAQNAEARFLEMVRQMDDHLKRNPQDGKGWEVATPVYMRLGRVQDAVAAGEKALELLGENASRLTVYAEALYAANQGKVSGKSRELFEKAASLDPRAGVARFYLGIAAEQEGDKDKARRYYADAVRIMPELGEDVRQRIAALDNAATAGEGQPQVDAETIDAMVDSLAARLDEQGGPVEQWVMLVRSYAVQGQKTKAAEAVAKARKALASDKDSLAVLDNVARSLKLENGGEQ